MSIHKTNSNKDESSFTYIIPLLQTPNLQRNYHVSVIAKFKVHQTRINHLQRPRCVSVVAIQVKSCTGYILVQPLLRTSLCAGSATYYSVRCSNLNMHRTSHTFPQTSPTTVHRYNVPDRHISFQGFARNPADVADLSMHQINRDFACP